MKKQNILTGAIAGMLVTLTLSQAGYANESSSHQKAANPTSDSHSSLVQKTTDKVAMFGKGAKGHKHPTTGKKGKGKKA